ncbi:MAG: hypothetical protein BHW12_02945 [Coprobacillus sp. 28_7]|nr:MAG: hypothetical protein BHW12_02945 [Coprobacillus sp. 28_7]CCY07302.1 unknown [Coprobacillus sp. CAG:698]
MGNLKNVYLLLILLFSLGIFIFVVYYDKEPNYNVFYIDKLADSEEIDLYLLDEEKEIKAVKVSIANKNDYREIFSLYNEKMNSVETHLTSPLVFCTEVKEINLQGDELTISIDKLSEEVDNDKLMLCLLKTYKEIGIKSIVLNSGKGSLRIK